MRIESILWDGINKIQGELVLDANVLSFVLSDFANTDLGFELPYHEVQGVDIHLIYGLSELAIQINSIHNGQNIFIVAEPKVVRDTILAFARINETQENNKK